MHRRTWIRSSASLACAAALAALTACATPPGGVDQPLLQKMDTLMRQAAPQLPVSLRLNSEQLTTGSTLQAEVASPVAGYVYLFQLSTDGDKLDLLFPNAMDGANYLPAGQRLALPRPNWRMAARGPAGVGYVMAVISESPQDLFALQAGLAAGRLDLRAPFGAAMSTLREVAP